MKKAIITTALLMAIASTGFSQKAFDDDTRLVSLGVGFGTPYWAAYLKPALPVNPTLHIEQSIGDGFSIGGTLMYSSRKWSDASDLRFNAIYLGGRAAYHFPLPQAEKVDLYAGAGLGYAIVYYSSKSAGASAAGTSGVGYNLFGGGRYYVAKKAAVYAELGYGSFSILNVGITIKAK